MKDRRKKILAIALIILVALLAAAAVFVTIKLQKAPVPTAPPRPRAAEYKDGGACTISFTIAATATSTPTPTVTPTPTPTVTPTPSLSCVSKEAYKNVASNSEGNYDLKEIITTVAQKETFVYTMKITNGGNATASAATLVDELTGENQQSLTFVDKDSGCTFDSAKKAVSCEVTNIAPGAEVTKSFRVKVSDAAANGQVIKNKFLLTSSIITSEGATTECSNDLTVSGVVSCDNTCTNNDQCSGGLKCVGGKCRNEACNEETDCICPTATPTVTATPTATATVTRITTPTATGTVTPTATATVTVTATATPTSAALPEAGIISLPGMAVFAGGLLLTILGILFAL